VYFSISSLDGHPLNLIAAAATPPSFLHTTGGTGTPFNVKKLIQRPGPLKRHFTVHHSVTGTQHSRKKRPLFLSSSSVTEPKP
jgi:hypothetical protein